MLPRIRSGLLFFLACGAAGGAQLTLPAVNAPAASTVLIPITLTGSSLSALQFDLQFSSPILTLNPTLGPSARAGGKSLNLWQVYPGVWRFAVTGLNQTAIPDGTLLNLLVSVRADAFPDTYPLQFLNVSACDPAAQPVTLSSQDGSLVVQGDPASAPRLLSWGVSNAASIAPGVVAPGEILTLFGASIGPANVSFDGVPAPILYAGAGQINLVAPYALAGKSTTELRLVQGTQTVATLQVPVQPASPAIFTLDATGAGPGAILNQDYGVNSPANPAAKGSVVMIYATGAGQTDPPGVDAQITGDTGVPVGSSHSPSRTFCRSSATNPSASPIASPTASAAPYSIGRFGFTGFCGTCARSTTVNRSDCCRFSISSDMSAFIFLSSSDL